MTLLSHILTIPSTYLIKLFGCSFSEMKGLAILVLDKICTQIKVNEARREAFCKQHKIFKNLPPTQDVLIHYVKCSIFQESLLTVAKKFSFDLPFLHK